MPASKDGGRSFSSHGYVQIRLRDGSREYEHTLIAEFVLGRPLKDDETVHHINGDRADNCRANLLICKRDYHVELHARLEASPDWPQFQPRDKCPRGQRIKGANGFKGIERVPSGRWLAYCSVDRRKHRIGLFDSAAAAARAYDEYVIANRHADWVTNKSLGLL